jgi:5-hydroxyisourate hydrolase-like protein (transthyretin family)
MALSTRKSTFIARLSVIAKPVAWGMGFAVICLHVGSLNCSAQEANCISVRVLDAKSGKPIKGLLTSVQTRSEHQRDFKSLEMTDAQGIVRFCLNDPIPASFRLEFSQFYETDPSGLVDTKAILEKGSVAGNIHNKGKFHDRETPKPGEMIIFGRRWWWIDRMLEKWFGEWP